MKIVVTGAAGIVGREVVRHCEQLGDEVAALDHAALDIADETSVGKVFDRERPDVVINCAAWTDVDGCEFDPAHARLANTIGPQLLAEACRKNESLLVTLSTDYVFDGEKDGFYTQRDHPNPKSVYGLSKLEGERAAQIAWARTVVVRSGYIFGNYGTNFLSTFLSRARRGEQLRVIDDMVGTPTYAKDLAERLRELALLDLPGTYHATNAGEGVSFAGFVRAAFEHSGSDAQLLTMVSCNSLQLAAPRPRNSRLKCLLSEAIGLRPLRHWSNALAEFVREQTTDGASTS